MRTLRAVVPLVLLLLAAEVAIPAAGASVAADRSDVSAAVSVVIVGSRSLDPATVAAASDGTAGDVRTIPAIGTTTIEVPAAEVAGTISELRKIRGVENVYREQRATAFDVTPNDPDWGRQGPLRSIGLPAAWSTSTGANTTVIAVVDTGVDNIAAFGGRVLAGYDFVNRDAFASDDSDAYHGTDAALLAAGGGNDGVGTAGVCWNCRILPVKVLDSLGSGALSDVAEGIVWAANNGADVINLSLGSDYPDPAVSNAVDYALARDVVVVASAGNTGDRGNPRNYPAATPGVLSVAGSNEARGLYPWSQRDPTWVDVAAPGCNAVNDGLPNENNQIAVYEFCGTSSAAPVVSGLAGLLRSARPAANRDMTVSAIVATADFPPTAGLVGYGIIDAARAISAVLTIAPGVPPLPPDVTPPAVSISVPSGYRSGIAEVAVNATDDQRLWFIEVRVDDVLVNVIPYPAAGTSIQQIDTTAYGDGPHRVQASVADIIGHRTDSNVVTLITDNRNPLGLLVSPSNGNVLKGSFTARAIVTDPNGIMGTFFIANGQVVGGFSGDGFGQVTVPIRRNGPISVVALTVDRAGHISGTNLVVIRGTVAKRRR